MSPTRNFFLYFDIFELLLFYIHIELTHLVQTLVFGSVTSLYKTYGDIFIELEIVE